MDEKAKDSSHEKCCGHGAYCCVCKTVGMLFLVLLGAVGGYFLGRCRGGKHICAAPMTATATPAADAPAPAK